MNHAGKYDQMAKEFRQQQDYLKQLTKQNEVVKNKKEKK